MHYLTMDTIKSVALGFLAAGAPTNHTSARSAAFSPAASGEDAWLPTSQYVPAGMPLAGVNDTHTCVVGLRAPRDKAGTAGEFFKYAAPHHNFSFIDIEAGREAMFAGPLFLEKELDTFSLGVVADGNVRVLSECRPPNRQTASLLVQGRQAEAVEAFLKTLPTGKPWWVSDDTTYRQIFCRESACLLQSYEPEICGDDKLPRACPESISYACVPHDISAPDKHILRESYQLFRAGPYQIVNHGADSDREAQLTSVAPYTGAPGCYLACYTASGLGSYEVSRGKYFAGQMRVSGHYEGNVCRPDNNVSRLSDGACEVHFEACRQVPCWTGGDTGGFFGLSGVSVSLQSRKVA